MSIEPLLTIQNNEQLNQLLQEQKTSISTSAALTAMSATPFCLKC